MNKIYKVVWSKVKHCYVVTSELAKRQTKGCGARSLRMATVSLGVAASLLCSGAVFPIFGESVAEAGSVGVVNKLIMGDGLEWNGSTTAVTITADTIDTINNNINADPRKHAYGNITYTYGSEKFNAIAERDVVSFKVVDGQLIECHDAPITNKDVSGYSITINNTSDKLLYAVYGGYSKEGNVSGNSATITNGTITDSVYGGYTNGGKVSNNTVNLNGGTVHKVYGGYTTGGAAETNHVVMNGGVVGITTTGGKTVFSGGQLYGAYSYNSSGNSGNVTGNTVTIDKGTVMADIYGGNTEAKNNKSGDAIKNIVTINGGTLAGDIYGGYSRGDGNPSGKVDGNEVKIAGGVLNKAKVEINGSNVETQGVRFIYGGYTYGNNGPSESTIAYKNAVTISGGTFNNNTEVTGGYSNLFNAELNTVNITKDFTSTVGDVTGGISVYDTAKENTVTIAGGIVSNVYGGSGTVAEKNSVNITGGTVNGTIYGGSSNSGAVTNNKVTVTGGAINDIIWGGDSNGGDAKYNAVTISGDAKIVVEGIMGGRSWNSEATGNTVTISGGSFEPESQDPPFNTISITAGVSNANKLTAKDNVVNITGEVTGLDTAEISGYNYNVTTHSGNELHVGGTKTYDSNGTATVSSSAAWQGKSSDGTVNNKLKVVSNFESIVLHNVKWSTTLPVLEATKITNIGTLDITNMQFDQTPSNGESMALLKAGNDLGASGAGIGLAYKDGSTEKTATSAELATGVTFDSGALTDTAVNGVSVTGTQSKKVSLENSNYEIRYAFSSTISGITIATDTFTSGGTARAFGSGDNLTGATITNKLAFSPTSKKNMASGTSMVILDATKAVAVSGATLPAFTAQTYKEKFDDPISGKVLTLSGTHTDTLALNTAKTQLIYTVGDKNVETAAFNGAVDFSTGDAYYKADSQYKFGKTNVDAQKLTFNETAEALTKGSSMTLLSATNITAGTVTQPDAATVAIKYGGDATNGITFNATATGSVAVEESAVKFKVNTVEASKIDLSNWNGTPADVATATSGWTLKAGETIETGELAKADLSGLKADETKTILTASDTVVFTNDAITGKKKWKEDGTSIAETTHESGVVISAGETTASGVKVNESNAHQLIYHQGKNNVTAITLGEVTFNTAKTAREFGNAYDLTTADINATNFTIKDAATTAMNAGEEMIVLDATDAIKKADGTALKGFTDEPGSIAVDFTDEKVDGKELTFEGTHKDTLSLNDKKTQVVYKVGEKEVNKATFTGEVAWNDSDSEAYYTNDTSKYKIAATNVDATNLKVTGKTTKALNNGDAMTLLSAEGMTATLTKDQSEANKAASKISVNYSDTASGIAFGATATGAVEATDNAVNYKVTGVTLNRVDLAGWNGTTSSVPGGWAIGDGATINTDGLAAPAVEPGNHVDILQNDTDNYFASATISGANTYQSTDFKDEMNGVTLEGKQDKGVTLNSEKKHLIYAAGTKNTASVSFGAVEWQKDATLADAAAGYDFTNVSEIGTDKFDVTYAKPEDVAINDSMTLLKANETLTAIVDELKTSSYKNYEIAPGVLMDGSITGTMSRSGNDVVFTATANQADKLTFTNVEWKDSGALMTRPANITFAGADVDTAKINFHNIQELAANSRMTLVSDFGETVGTITGDTFTVGSGLQGEGAASLSGTDLVFTAKTGAESLTPTEATHETVMAMEAGTAVVAAGCEYVDSAVEGLGLVSNMAPDGTSTFASMGGGVGRYKTGSHVDTHTWSAVVAVGSKRDHKKGNLEWGVFAEYGRGNYTLHDDNGGRGDGNTHYAGGGLLAKWTNKHDVYTEASFRMGRMSDSASNMLRDVLGNTYGYDVHANYFGGHVGLGKIYKVKGNKDLDVYGKFFYTRRNGVDFDAGGNHYSLDSVASKLLRIGARYGSNDRKWNWYGGLAYEYEFGGESKGSVDGLAIRSASIKGASVRGEIGVRLEATKTNPWKADISIYGYGGKHRGIGGTVSVAYMF